MARGNRPAGRLPPDCRLVVFDVDGTLYRQRPVRWAMLGELLTTRAQPGEPRPLERLRILRRFRILRERIAFETAGNFDTHLFDALASETGRPAPSLRVLVRDWMERRPVRHLSRAAVPGARELFAALRDRGIAIGIWSDYPVPDKLAALGLAADHLRTAADADVGALKPNPAGLRRLLEVAGCAPEQALMIGDRMSRDGAAAATLGVPFILLGRERAAPEVIRLQDFRPLVATLRAEP